MYFVLGYYLAVNLIAMVCFAVDKSRAIHQKRRISEASLFLLSGLGGCFLGYLSMFVFHHKTRIMKFHGWMICMIILHSYLLAVLLPRIS